MADLCHLEKMGRELKCPICLSLLTSAVSLTCNHVFCNACILKSMKSGSACPVCKVPYHRREVRAAPHMDNLVSIYRSMEVASGVNIFVSQITSPNKSSDQQKCIEVDPKCSGENVNTGCQNSKDQQASKSKWRRATNKSSQECPDRVSVRPSFPTKKRVHVPHCVPPETPIIPAQDEGVHKRSEDEYKETTAGLDEAHASTGNRERALSPFFWLRDEEEEEHFSQCDEGDQLLDITPPDVPSFSDLKDSDCESPSKAEEHDGSRVQFDSEMFEWTQRPSSPELLLSPAKSQVPDTEDNEVKETVLGTASAASDDNTGNANCTVYQLEAELSDKRSRKLKNSNTQASGVKSNAEGRNSKNLEAIRKNRNRDKVLGFQIDNKKSEAFESKQAILYKGSSTSFGKNTRGRKLDPLTNLAAKPTAGKDTGVATQPQEENNCNEDEQLSSAFSKERSADNIHGVNKKRKDFSKGCRGSNYFNLRSLKQKLVSATGNIHEEVPTAQINARKSVDVQNHFSPPSSGKYRKTSELQYPSTEAKNVHSNLGSECGMEPSCADEKKGALGDGFARHHGHPEGCRNFPVDGPESTKVDLHNHAVKVPCRSSRAQKPGMALRQCTTLANQFQCAFCHAHEDEEASEEMVHYYNGQQVSADYDGGSKIIHSHRSCTEWAPNVYFEDDIAINLEAELARSRRIMCSGCGLKGAALGCYEKSCRKSFHVPCAKLIPECRWDTENYVMLCPLHASSKLPCEDGGHKKKKQKVLSDRQLLPQHSQLAVKNGISFSQKLNLIGLTGKLVLCCSALTVQEKEYISKFKKLSGITVLKNWEPNVTHVIASTNESGACKRTFKVLMGIIEGKWVLSIEWVKACLKAMRRVEEEQYEIALDVHGIMDGPRLGRERRLNKLPKLFDGLKFYFMGDFEPCYKGYLQDLVIAGGGTILHRKPISEGAGLSSSALPSSTFVLYNDLPDNCNMRKGDMVSSRTKANAAALASSVGAKAVSNTWVLNSLASSKLQILAE